MNYLLIRMARAMVLTVFIAGCVGCAGIKTMPDLSLFGEADPEKEALLLKKYKNEPKVKDKQAVQVLVDTVPKGIQVSDGQISSEAEYEHEVLGHFSFRPDFKRESTGALDGFSNYKGGWRKVLCYPQVALSYATFGIWDFIPTSYPCYGHLKQTKQEMIEEAKKMTTATGGNVAVISYIKDNENKVLGAVGYAIKLDPRFKDNFETKEATLVKSKKI